MTAHVHELGTPDSLTHPRPLSDGVERDRLRQRLDRSAGQRLVLACAPAGYGKTALLADWALSSQRRSCTCWLTTPPRASDPATLVGLIAAGLRESLPDGQGDAFGAPLPDRPRDALLELATAVGRSGRPVVTVLDDYQAVEGSQADRAVADLLSVLPPNWTVVIGTRTEPQLLPLPRLRASLELTELRAADLRFTAEEGSELLARTAHRTVSTEVARSLVDRTEGWAAGLRLAALEMEGASDDTAFARDFDGRHAPVAAYFAKEVFEPLEPELREFLLLTSVLDDILPAVADSLRESDDSREVLLELARRNAFVQTCDARGERFRYHGMFRSWLLGELRARRPGLESSLLRRIAAAELKAKRPSRPAANRRPRPAPDAPRLTESQFVVLERLAGDASLREIGAQLYLSLNTVKSHTRGIYRKLGVGSRPAALDRARELGILPPDGEAS